MFLLKLIKENMESFRVKIFLTLTFIILMIITVFILFNKIILEAYLIYSQEKVLINLYQEINDYYDDPSLYQQLLDEIEKLTLKSNIDIIIIGNSNEIIYSTNDLFAKSFYQVLDSNIRYDQEVLMKTQDYKILKTIDYKTDITYLIMTGQLDNGFKLYIRAPINSIQDNVAIVDRFLYIIAIVTILISIVIIIFISNVISKPIIELRLITKKMKDLDFSHRFKEGHSKDEIELLGHNINVMADSLEFTIEELKAKNSNLIKDIEEKTKIDEMRTTFISDVSHELKTPIAIIQGYAEGLLNGISEDEESRKYYTEVIVDEANKMDRLVKSLLELMKLEYGKREFKNSPFNIIDMEKESVNVSSKLFENRDIKIIFDKDQKPIIVYADKFYIEQVFSNYMTNAFKYAKPRDGKLFLRITNKIVDDGKKVRICVENTGENFSDEFMQKIWIRFYKGDKSRHRSANSSGIGLSLVKAIMNNYQNKYGVINTPNGVEFYFELDIYDKNNKERMEMLDRPQENLINEEKEIKKLDQEELNLSDIILKESKIIENSNYQSGETNNDNKEEIQNRKHELKVKIEGKIQDEPFDKNKYLNILNKIKKSANKNKNKNDK